MEDITSKVKELIGETAINTIFYEFESVADLRRHYKEVENTPRFSLGISKSDKGVAIGILRNINLENPHSEEDDYSRKCFYDVSDDTGTIRGYVRYKFKPAYSTPRDMRVARKNLKTILESGRKFNMVFRPLKGALICIEEVEIADDGRGEGGNEEKSPKPQNSRELVLV